MTNSLKIIESHGIIEVVFTRAKKLNAINREMLDELADAVEKLADDAGLHVMLIRAEGEYFSSGADVSSLAMPDLSESPSRFLYHYRRGSFPIHDFLDEMEAVEKPIVVAHQGPCLGGALEMSLSCDFRLAARSASYGLPEAAMGLLPGSGGVSRLTRIAGPHWARWLVMAGKQLSAEEALAAGIVHQVFDDEGFAESARRFCEELASKPPEMLAMAKLAIELSKDLDRGQARNVERMSNSALVFGQEHKDLLAALKRRLQRKKP